MGEAGGWGGASLTPHPRHCRPSPLQYDGTAGSTATPRLARRCIAIAASSDGRYPQQQQQSQPQPSCAAASMVSAGRRATAAPGR